MSVTLEKLIEEIVDKRFELQKEALIEEITLDLMAKQQQTTFNQTELAEKCGVSVPTIIKWRKKGLQCEPSVTSELRFDINKVNKWREENDTRKVR